jgi:hypothetical protein
VSKAKLGRKCSICNHEKVEEINRLLLEGVSLRDIAGRYSVSKTSLGRHKKQHIPAAMSKAVGAHEAAQADDLLAQVVSLRDKALSILIKAEKAGDLRTALQGVREAKGCLELLAKLQGELQQEGTINITLAPEWVQLRTVILQAIEPFPEARSKLAQAVKEVEGNVGR